MTYTTGSLPTPRLHRPAEVAAVCLRWLAPTIVLLLLGGLVAAVGVTGGNAMARPSTPVAGEAPDVNGLLRRADTLETRLAQVQSYYEQNVAPIQRVLVDYGAEPAAGRTIAMALVREANRAGLEPRVLLAVLLVENPELNPRARSRVGAVGLMQVMPMHQGRWAACSGPLTAVDGNICYGAQIFASLYRRTHDPDEALLRYNGCVNGTNTPDCHSYPYHVYARAGRASLLAWLSPHPVGAAMP